MKKWLETFLYEKGIQSTVYDVVVDGELHIMDLDSLKKLIYAATRLEQQTIKNQLIQIDFVNGDVHHYFKHLIKAYVINTKQLH